ncbi:MAG: TolC family protein [Acidobacteria bacterium]|nr:TolC family protein [Acidobacteriota bacterium]
MSQPQLAPLRSFILILGLLGSPAAVCSQQPASGGDVLTLEQVIDIALQNNRSVKRAELEVGKSEDQVAIAKMRRLPSFSLNTLGTQLLTGLDFTFPQGAFGTYRGIGPIPTRETVISTPRRPVALILGQVAQPLSQLYRIKLNIEQLKLGEKMVREELRAQRQDIVNNVKRGYYGILQTQSALESSEHAIRLYRELERVTGEYVAQQVVLLPEYLDVKTRLAKAQYEILVLHNLLATQKEQLNNTLGRDIRTDLIISPLLASDQFVLRETDLAAAHERALAQRPEVREARLRVQRLEYDRRIKKAEAIPDISLSLNYISLPQVSVLPKNALGIGILVNLEPFDWGRRRRELAEKDKTLEQAKLAIREAENLILIDVNSKFRKLQETSQLLKVTRMAQDAARASLKVATFKYRVEASILKDLLQVQTLVADANYQYHKALLSFWTAKADFEKAIGEEK